LWYPNEHPQSVADTTYGTVTVNNHTGTAETAVGYKKKQLSGEIFGTEDRTKGRTCTTTTTTTDRSSGCSGTA
jgi:hypothetical protein